MGLTINDLLNLNTPLTNIQTRIVQDTSNYISPKAFPLLRSDEIAGKYPIWDTGDWTRIVAQKRAPATESVGGDFNTAGAGTFFCDKWSVHKDVPDEFRGMTRILDLHQAAVRWTTNQVLLARDIDWIDTFFKTGVWGQDVTPATLWNVAGSTPIDDISLYKLTAQENKAAGMKLNTLIMGPRVWRRMKSNADFLGRVSGGATAVNPAMVTLEMLKNMLELDNVWVIDTVYSTTKEGQAVTNQFAAGNSALLCYVAPNASILEPSAGYNVAWVFDGSGPVGGLVKEFRMDKLDADRVESTVYMDHIVVAPALGVFINGAVAS